MPSYFNATLGAQRAFSCATEMAVKIEGKRLDYDESSHIQHLPELPHSHMKLHV